MMQEFQIGYTCLLLNVIKSVINSSNKCPAFQLERSQLDCFPGMHATYLLNQICKLLATLHHEGQQQVPTIPARKARTQWECFLNTQYLHSCSNRLSQQTCVPSCWQSSGSSSECSLTSQQHPSNRVESNLGLLSARRVPSVQLCLEFYRVQVVGLLCALRVS